MRSLFRYQRALALNPNCQEARDGLEKIQNPVEEGEGDESMGGEEEEEDADESGDF